VLIGNVLQMAYDLHLGVGDHFGDDAQPGTSFGAIQFAEGPGTP
jgi:hypothetical protein